jgi:CDP-glucose 4,6-dehydratase
MKEDWRGVRVAVTGHTGFKGAWLAYVLARRGADVSGYALPPATAPNLFDALDLGKLVRSTFGDLGDFAALRDFFERARPNVLFHFAAQPLVRAGYERPRETFDTNVLGTIACLERALAIGTPVTVVATSDKCYRNDGSFERAFSESDPLGGNDPYSASKAAAEIAIESYRLSFFRPKGLALASVRAGNVIGGGDWSEDRLFTDLARAAFEGKPLRIRYPKAARPWQHVLDALRGYLAIAEAAMEGKNVDEPWNLGPAAQEAMTVESIVRGFEAAIDTKLHVEAADTAGKPEALALQIDARKAGDRLGWQPRLTVVQAVEMTAAWYAAFYRGVPAREIADRQIGVVLGDAVGSL